MVGGVHGFAGPELYDQDRAAHEDRLEEFISRQAADIMYPEDSEDVSREIAALQERWGDVDSPSLRKMFSKMLCDLAIRRHGAKFFKVITKIPEQYQKFLLRRYGEDVIEVAKRWGTEDYGTVRVVIGNMSDLTSQQIKNLCPEDVTFSIPVKNVFNNNVYNYEYLKTMRGIPCVIGFKKVCGENIFRRRGFVMVQSHLKDVLERGGKVYKDGDAGFAPCVLVTMPEGVGLPVVRADEVGPSAR